MKSLYTKAELQSVVSAWKNDGLRVGFVPTMGALHEGHLSLVEKAHQESDRVIVSIFVNPTQFAPHEDLDTYPRQEAQDQKLLEDIGAHAVYLPSAEEMYPNGRESNVKAGAPAKGMETDFRPHFFDGVVNVVHRLFDHIRPDIAVFGEKDFQQLQVIDDMVQRLDMPLSIIGGATVRDALGLALSSRNAYLSDEEITTARQLNTILFRVAAQLKDKPATATEADILDDAKAALLEAGFDKIDYVEERWDRVLAAAWIGTTRLIDNVAVPR